MIRVRFCPFHYLEGKASLIFRGRLDPFFLSSLFDQNFNKTAIQSDLPGLP
jgi:hypothetical protein